MLIRYQSRSVRWGSIRVDDSMLDSSIILNYMLNALRHWYLALSR